MTPLVLDEDQGNVEHSRENDEREHDVVREVERGVDLDPHRHVGLPDFRKDLPRGLDRSFCPSELLRLQCVDLRRKLRGRRDVVQIDKPPSFQLCTVRQVEVFGKRVRMPVPRVQDRILSPDPAGTVKVDEESRPVPDVLFHHKMSVERECLRSREERIFAVEMFPTRLYQPHVRVGEMRYRLLQEIRVGHKVGVEDGQEFAARMRETFLQGARLVARPVRPANVLNVVPKRLEFLDGPVDNVHGLVRRIVQYLDLQLLFRIVKRTNSLDEPSDNVEFVVDRQLHGHDRRVGERRLEQHVEPLLPQVVIDHHKPVGSEREQNEKGNEIQVQHEIGEEIVFQEFLAKQHEVGHGHDKCVTIQRRCRSICLL